MKAGSFYQNYREVTLLVVHCSATRCDRHFSVEALRRSHLARGFADIGYHFYITRDGEVHICRPVHQIGAHATGWNDKSIGICYEGGLDENGACRYTYLCAEMLFARLAPAAEDRLSQCPYFRASATQFLYP